MTRALGIDTSCYTTSVACAENGGIVAEQRAMLSVPFGQRGLRQSDGVFQHMRRLPELLETLFSLVDGRTLDRVCVSARPVGAMDSYMPVFLAGLGAAREIAAALCIPLFETDHQSGHLRAALYGNEALLAEEKFLAVHLSGGTTDVLLVQNLRPRGFAVTRLGCSTDLHAGQFVDRVGVAMGAPFPAGKTLEQRARAFSGQADRLPCAVKGADCSFSGAESAAQRLLAAGADGDMLAYAVYDCLSRTLCRMLKHAAADAGELPVLLCGGVASSTLLRELLKKGSPLPLVFGRSELSSDNAAGVALLCTDGEE